MAINPQDLMRRVAGNNKNALERLEEKVDDALAQTFDGRRAIISRNREFSQLPQYLREQFLEQYRAQGWNVKEQFDQRDGDYLEFSFSQGDLSGGYFRR
ncbi:hypothetical protein COY27_06640 [Candidatus Woesearchaeota archaeon CG_4_10_14_0_2_um_filter_33_13]|nr:MAG: hypothetical protein COY27_06640 [Candidatus Woesearchaeota archaeon CG_4_10_14_0_2_um_filter_33_13]